MNWMIVLAISTAPGSALDVDPLACQNLAPAIAHVVSAQIGAAVRVSLPQCRIYKGPLVTIPESALPPPPVIVPGWPPGHPPGPINGPGAW